MLKFNSNPVSFVLENILFPVIRQWITCFLEFGFLLEPHGQNLLLELDPKGRVTRCVHRDLSLGIDMRRRRDLGRDNSRLNAYNRMETGSFASIAYDKSLLYPNPGPVRQTHV